MPARIPVSTYRLQFHHDFRFTDACALVPYLDALGVTDCYASPILKASPSSKHGYDICDHSQLNPEVGSEAEYRTLAAALAARGMGLVVDFVPNHMGIDPAANPWWRDVLENGPCSPYADFFDIDWDPVKDELHGKVLLPILGDQYGVALERGEMQLAFEEGVFTLRYFEHNLPINPRQLTRILEHDVDLLRRDLGEDSPALSEYLSIATALRNLPVYTETDPALVVERHREKEVARERLQRLVTTAPRIRQHIENAVRVFNGEPGRPQSFDHLHALLEAQPYRLAYWRTAAHEINYRRFFDVNELAGLRMEREHVFDATHQLILRLVAAGQVTGLRIDHVDGLHDPAQYLKRLQAAAGGQLSGSADRPGQPLYVVVEKILAAGESLPTAWPVAGTSGYDFLNDLNGLFVNRANQRALTRTYGRFTHLRTPFADLAYASKKLIMELPMSSELNVLAHALNRLSERDRRTRDFTLNSLRDALEEVVACLGTYRTYVSATSLTDVDRTAIETALRRARGRNATMEPSIFEFLRAMLLPQPTAAGSADDRRLQLEFAMKFQQYTGPVQAKGIEDTVFYRYNRLLSLNEVGGAAERFGCSPGEFHAANQRRRAQWPLTMVATATHDTKRGEDARARLNVLSELPDAWRQQLSAWTRINRRNHAIVDGAPAPDRNDEYLFYQSLLGVWPAEPVTVPLRPDDALLARVRDFMIKAVREAKVHTSWVAQNHAYEEATLHFVESSLAGPTAARFLHAFLPFQGRVARLGMLNSLAQVVLKVAAPGVPDFYQGTELWNLSLVDPDNRRPVDYDKRWQLLGEMEPLLAAESADPAQRTAAVAEMLAQWHDGRIKLFLTAAALRLRRRMAPLFLDGSYEPLLAAGERADHVLAFARRLGDSSAVVVAPRLVAPLLAEGRWLPVGAASWGDTRLLLPQEDVGRSYCNVVTGETLRAPRSGRAALPVAAVLRACPVALLRSVESAG
jgi:(1->4)-alpha-D-glucan 1-alpha-D-glucosylmutase